jgi:predicted metalloprotease with PDZ domain
MSQVRSLACALALAAATALLAPWAAAQAGQPNAAYLRALAVGRHPTLRYTLDLRQPNGHLAAVTLLAPSPGARIVFAMPAWYPGRYSIYNFAVNVQQARASCAAGGAPLAVRRLDPNRWQVSTGGCPTVRWQYRVYGNTPLNGSFFQLDATHANLNGGAVFMVPEGDKPDPVRLHILAPPDWKVLNELGRLNQTDLWFPNYDIFIDAPTEAAPAFTLDRFHLDGKTYRVLIHDYLTPSTNGPNRAALLASLKAIARVENAVVAPDELDTYTFFFHFDRGSFDGMEHLFGTQIMVPDGLATPAGLTAAEADAAHEYFHQWNVKRIRPRALGPWNYEAPNPTPSLWVAEGFTQYYGEISLERAGLVSRRAYLDQLGAALGQSLTAPAYKLMSAEDASLTAWFHDATPLRQDTNTGITTISYYTRGMQIAAVLDLDLRRRTGGRRSLNDVLRWLWRNTYHAPRATYYLPGRGYTDADVERAIESVAGGRSYARFFRDYVAGTKPIPYDRYLAAAGLRLACAVPAGTLSYSGVYAAGNRVLGVAPGSAGERAGFGKGMILTAVNGLPPAVPPPGQQALNLLPPGQPAAVAATEHGARLTLTLTPAPPLATQCTLAGVPVVTPAQRALRQAWLQPR